MSTRKWLALWALGSCLLTGTLVGCEETPAPFLSPPDLPEYQPRPDRPATTPLIDAARQNDLNTVQSLLEKGADPNEDNDAGVTALHVAAQEANVEIANALLAAGADPKRCTAGMILASPLHWAVTMKARGTMKVRFSPDGPDTTWTDAPINEDERARRSEVVRLLVARGAPVDVRDRGGTTPLMRVNDDAVIAGVLLDLGADVNTADTQGNTALHRQARVFMMLMDAGVGHRPAESLAMMETFLKRGAQVNAKNRDGETPLDRAAGARLREQLSEDEVLAIPVVALLRKYGARFGDEK